jgi:hypothetical protein
VLRAAVLLLLLLLWCCTAAAWGVGLQQKQQHQQQCVQLMSTSRPGLQLLKKYRSLAKCLVSAQPHYPTAQKHIFKAHSRCYNYTASRKWMHSQCSKNQIAPFCAAWVLAVLIVMHNHQSTNESPYELIKRFVESSICSPLHRLGLVCTYRHHARSSINQ